MAGYMGKILRVDLSSGKLQEEPINAKMKRDFIGGRGFGAKMLYDDLKPHTDPLGDDNEMIFLVGPLCGTNAQSFGRWSIFFRSPLTGTGFSATGGGFLGNELKAAGFDGLIIKGKAEKPVYLWVHDGKYELKDASDMWGLSCDQTHTYIREQLHDPLVRIATIGPSGERLVKMAGVFSDRRAAARGGGGAVMGAKNLKAIALRGTARPEVANTEAFAAAVKEEIAMYRSHPMFEAWTTAGTQIAQFTNLLGMYPTKNFREGVLPNWEKIQGSEYDKVRSRNTGCHSCMLHCASITKAVHGTYNRPAWTEGPEYETIWAFSGPFNVADIPLTIAADSLCDDLGLDTISAGSTLGWAYELYEKGILTKGDTGGIELKYGDAHPILGLLTAIAYREGFGDVLADGTVAAAKRIGKGSEQFAIQVKGLELPAYDPRGAKAHGLNLLTANLGADHNSGYGSQEVFGVPFPFPVDRFATDRKGELCKWNQDLTAMVETGIMCTFIPSLGMTTPEIYGKLLSAATGEKDFADPAFLWKVGERIFNQERLFNSREGFNRKDDAFPSRFTKDKMPAGPSAGQVFELEPLLEQYYQVRGWDKNGVPTPAKIKELGL